MIKFKPVPKVRIINNSKSHSAEELLIIKSQKGDDVAFKKLMDSYEEYLYKMAFLYVKNDQGALDIYQETVLKAYLNISKLKDTSSFKSWITKILINNIYSIYKDFNIVAYGFNENITAEYSYINIEERFDMYDAIDILEEKYRTPIILQYFYDLTIKQISEITSTSESTIKTNIIRGKIKMYDILRGGCHV